MHISSSSRILNEKSFELCITVMFRTEFDCPELTCVVDRTLKSKTVRINTSQIIHEITKTIHQKVKNIYSEKKKIRKKMKCMKVVTFII